MALIEPNIRPFPWGTHPKFPGKVISGDVSESHRGDTAVIVCQVHGSVLGDFKATQQFICTAPDMMRTLVKWHDYTMSHPEITELQTLHLDTLAVLLRAGCTVVTFIDAQGAAFAKWPNAIKLLKFLRERNFQEDQSIRFTESCDVEDRYALEMTCPSSAWARFLRYLVGGGTSPDQTDGVVRMEDAWHGTGLVNARDLADKIISIHGEFFDVWLSIRSLQEMICSDMTQAEEEGWGVFNGKEIQRIDTAEVFASDDEAVEFVKRRAEEGSEFHKAVLAARIKT